MAHLWLLRDGRWDALTLAAPRHVFDGGGWRAADSDATVEGGLAIVAARGEAAETWVLAAPSHSARRVRVNGRPVVTGLRVLADRDEISVGTASWFFSSEALARIEPFAGARPVTCPRCKTAIVPGEPSVCCPGCRVTYHQHDDRPCFTYGDTCALCRRATALDDQRFDWSPEVL